jgi:DNA polymerase III delta prime subunit
LTETILSEKYRPVDITDVILPAELAKSFQQMILDNDIPNMMFAGSAGIGKSTVAMAILRALGCDYIKINGSKEGNIDTLRSTIMEFVSTVSFEGGRKMVLIEEADGMSAKMQEGLRDVIENYSSNAGFILTCNFKNKIIEPLHSRCPPVDFTVPKAERAKVAFKFMTRLEKILQTEGIDYDREAVAGVIDAYFPDWRKMLGIIQRYSKTGKIDIGILARKDVGPVKDLIGFMKGKDFTKARKWITENSDIDSQALYRSLYDELPAYLSGSASLAGAIIILAEYEYKEAFVVNSEINRAAAVASLMAECVWS